VTVCSHATKSHYLVGANLTDKSSTYLSLDNPIRQVLLPTELNSINGFSLALLFLLSTNQLFTYTFSYTNNGLIYMINDYVMNIQLKRQIFEDDMLPNLHLSYEEKCLYPLSSYNTYFKLYDNFAERYVNEFLSSKHNTFYDETNCWLNELGYSTTEQNKYALKTVIRSAFFTQIQHQMMSNDSIIYISSKFPSNIMQSKYDNVFYVDLETQLSVSFMFKQASSKIIPITKNMSFLVDDKHLKRIVHEFYQELQHLDKHYPKTFIKNLKPSFISSSTGY